MYSNYEIEKVEYSDGETTYNVIRKDSLRDILIKYLIILNLPIIVISSPIWLLVLKLANIDINKLGFKNGNLLSSKDRIYNYLDSLEEAHECVLRNIEYCKNGKLRSEKFRGKNITIIKLDKETFNKAITRSIEKNVFGKNTKP